MSGVPRFEIETKKVYYWEPHEGNCEATVYLAFHIDKDGVRTLVTTYDGQVSRFGNEVDAQAAIDEYKRGSQ